MDQKKRSREEIEERIEELENLIAKYGVGSNYLSKAERIQRDVNLALFLGGITAILGVTAWSVYKLSGE